MKTTTDFFDEENLDDLEKMAPTLSKLNRRLPFEVPANYFDELPMIIQEKCVQQKSTTISVLQKIIFLTHKKYFAFGMIILVISAGTFFYKNTAPQKIKNTSITANTDDITTTLTDNLSVDDESLLIESMPDNSVATNEKTENDQSITNYLIDNDIDVNTIIDTQN